MGRGAPAADAARGQTGIFMTLVIAAVALVMFTVVLLVGVSLVDGVVSGIGGQAGPVNTSASPDPVTGQAVSFEDTSGEATVTQVYDVVDSRGYAVALTGASDSYVQTDSDVTLTSDATWSVSTYAAVDATATGTTMTALSVDGRILLQYNGTAGSWAAWYYNESSRNSYRVSVTAPDPTNLTRIEARHNGSALTIYRNTTQGTTATTGTSNTADAWPDATNWDGRLDETRTFDDPLPSSERASLVTNPVGPAPGTNRTARLMYDQGGGTTTPIYFAGADATLSNASWVGGLPGASLTEGADYELDTGAGTITALANGRIGGAPVVWIDYRYNPADEVASLGQTLVESYGIFGVAALVIPGVAVLAVLVGGLALAVRQTSSARNRRR